MGLNLRACIAVFFLMAGLAGQERDEVRMAAADTLPFKTTFPDKITFRIGWQETANRFVIRQDDGTSFRYRPVNRSILKISGQFRGLDLGPIYIRPDESRELLQNTVQFYPEMFTARALYQLEEGLTTVTADYIRWALRIDPNHPHARQLAREYNIHGDPLQLRPKAEPRAKRALPGVRQ